LSGKKFANRISVWELTEKKFGNRISGWEMSEKKFGNRISGLAVIREEDWKPNFCLWALREEVSGLGYWSRNAAKDAPFNGLDTRGTGSTLDELRSLANS
jgi:hypothetical protein